MEIARPLSLRSGTLAARPARYGYQNLPLFIGMGYCGTVFLLFLTWPIDWPIYGAWNWTLLIGYVLICFAAIVAGFLAGRTETARDIRLQPLGFVPFAILAGAVAAVVLMFPTSYIYTGRWPWQVLSALQDPGDAYRSLSEQLLATDGQRGPIALARAAVAPAIFAVIPLGIVNWRRLSWLVRSGIFATALASIILSILRGTDRELADLFIVAGSAILVAIGRQSQAGGQLVALVKRYWVPAVFLLLFLWVAAGLFTDRKTARLGGYDQRIVVCANVSRICADMDAPIIAWMPVEQRFGTSLFVLSSASGYYGLSLGLEKDWRPTWGFGHSPAALAIYEFLTRDDDLRQRTYTYRNGFDGWSDENYWSTLILWLANDMSLPGAPLGLAFMGFVWGRAWRDATQRHSDAAAVIFCLTMIMIFYLSANNQVFALYEGYTVFFSWLFIWLRQPLLRLVDQARE